MKDPIFQRLLNLHPKFSDLSLWRIKKLLKRINCDENLLPKVIHIAGTNGKGSTAAILKSILNHHDYSFEKWDLSRIYFLTNDRTFESV